MSIQKILLCDLSRGRNWRNSKRWDKRGSKRPWPPWWLVSRFLGEKRKMDRAQIDHKKFAQWRIDIQIKARIWKKHFLHLILIWKTYVVGTQKNRLNETVLLSAQNTCLILVRKTFQFTLIKKFLNWNYGLQWHLGSLRLYFPDTGA